MSREKRTKAGRALKAWPGCGVRAGNAAGRQCVTPQGGQGRCGGRVTGGAVGKAGRAHRPDETPHRSPGRRDRARATATAMATKGMREGGDMKAGLQG